MRRWIAVAVGAAVLIGALYVGTIVVMNIGVAYRLPHISN